MVDESTYNVDHLTRLEGELAALVRQYERAADAEDAFAKEVEAEAICGRLRWLAYHHLDLRIGMSSDEWVWFNAEDEDIVIERSGPHHLRARGRFWCSLPEGPLRQWTEPFAADIKHSPGFRGLDGYTVWVGSPATILDLATVRQLVTGGEVLHARTPDREDGWAFVFRMGEHS